jgi:hypothetical protein
MNSRDFAEIGLDLSNPNVWGRKVFEKVSEKLDFKLAVGDYQGGCLSPFAVTARFEFDGSDIEIVVDYGYVEIRCSKNDGDDWGLGFSQIDDMNGFERLY